MTITWQVYEQEAQQSWSYKYNNTLLNKVSKTRYIWQNDPFKKARGS